MFEKLIRWWDELFTRRWIGVLTILILFVIEILFIIIFNVLLGFPNNENGDPIIFLQMALLLGIITLWFYLMDYFENPPIRTLFGIICLFFSTLLVGEWYIINGIVLLIVGIAVFIFLYSKLKPRWNDQKASSENGIPSDDSRYIPS